MPAAARTASTGVRLVRGVTSLATLVVLVAAVPMVLAKVADGPLPDHVPSLTAIQHALTTTDSGGRLLLRTLLAVAWLGWAVFALSVLLEIPTSITGRRPVRIPGIRWAQRFAAGLLAGITLLFAAPVMAATAPPTAAPPAVVTVAVAPGSVYLATPAVTAATSPAAGTLVYEVKRGDWLGKIAERYLGDFNRYPEIAALNRDLIPDRSGPHGPNHIEPMWLLYLPSNAVDRGPIRHASGNAVAAPGAQPGGVETPPPPPPPPPLQPPTQQPAPTPTRVPSDAADPGAGGGGITGNEKGSGPAVATPGDVARAHGIHADAAHQHALIAAVAGISAAGVLAAHLMVWRRRSVVREDEEVADAWLAAVPTIAMEANLSRLDLALRDLGSALAGRPPQDMPDIIGSWLSDGAVHLMLTGPCPPPPAPWVAAGNKWTLAASAPTYTYFAAQLPPLPALVTVGSQEGTSLLLDLERLGLVTISGEPNKANDLLRHMAAELSNSVWSHDMTVTIAGFDREDARQLVTMGGGRVRPTESIPAAIEQAGMWARESQDLLHAKRLTDPFSGRLGTGGDDSRKLMPHALLLANPTPADLSRLANLDAELARLQRGPLAIAVTTSVPLGRWPMVVDTDRQVTIDFLDTRIPAATLASDDLAGLTALHEAARRGLPETDPDEIPIGRHRMRARQLA